MRIARPTCHLFFITHLFSPPIGYQRQLSHPLIEAPTKAVAEYKNNKNQKLG
jgi:hypothetical protein